MVVSNLYTRIYMLVFFTIFFIKHESLKQFYLYLKLLQSSTIFKQKSDHEVSSH